MTSTTKSAPLSRAAVSKQIAAVIPPALAAADNTSADRVQHLSLVNQARVSRLTRTAASVTTQYGAQSPQAASAQAAVSSAQSTVARIQVLHQQVATPMPTVAAAGWALHGRVYDSNLSPQASHTVFLVDSQKTYQETYGFAYTDSTGYFLINYLRNKPTPTPAPGKPAPANKSAVPPTPAESAPPPTAESTGPLFVQIANPAGKPVYLSATAWQPSTGLAAYQKIILPTGEPPLGDPPEEIRKLALPPPKKSSS